MPPRLAAVKRNFGLRNERRSDLSLILPVRWSLSTVYLRTTIGSETLRVFLSRERIRRMSIDFTLSRNAAATRSRTATRRRAARSSRSLDLFS